MKQLCFAFLSMADIFTFISILMTVINLDQIFNIKTTTCAILSAKNNFTTRDHISEQFCIAIAVREIPSVESCVPAHLFYISLAFKKDNLIRWQEHLKIYTAVEVH